MNNRAEKGVSCFLLPWMAIFILCFYLIGCAPVQTCVPGRPLRSGETEGRVGISFTTSNFAKAAIQGGVYWGLSDQDVLGLSFNSWVLPSRISYARYFNGPDSGYWNGNLQAHLGTILGGEMNPVLEIGAAVSYSDRNLSQTAKAAVGYFAPSWLNLVAGSEIPPKRVVPIFAYQVQAQSVLAEIEIIYGMSRQHTEEMLLTNNRNLGGLVLQHDDVKKVEQVGDVYAEAVWNIWLTNGDMITVSDRDPYADCFACSNWQKKLSAYIPTSGYRSLWIYLNHSDDLQLLALNMNDVLSRFDKGGDLSLVQDSNIEAMIRDNVKSGREDLGVFVGYSDRTPRK